MKRALGGIILMGCFISASFTIFQSNVVASYSEICGQAIGDVLSAADKVNSGDTSACAEFQSSDDVFTYPGEDGSTCETRLSPTTTLPEVQNARSSCNQ